MFGLKDPPPHEALTPQFTSTQPSGVIELAQTVRVSPGDACAGLAATDAKSAAPSTARPAVRNRLMERLPAIEECTDGNSVRAVSIQWRM
ncbi:hypothetical protein GCM10020000_48780 [Streptomyces olivoverticillatus]